jgi:hypothetical protein
LNPGQPDLSWADFTQSLNPYESGALAGLSYGGGSIFNIYYCGLKRFMVYVFTWLEV